MRTGVREGALQTAASWGVMVSSWLGGVVLANSVPVASGRVSWSVSNRVTSALRMTVPRTSVEGGRTVDWRPSDPRAPLARYGQTLDVSLLVDGVLLRLGRFLITDWSDNDDDSISVTGAGQLRFVADDRLTAATAPRDDGTLRSEFARLTPGYMSAQFHASLVDRAVPKTMEWKEDRLAALYEIADTWPARLREDSWGGITVLPPLPEVPVPVVSLTDGEGGTVVSATTTDTRDGAYNVFVVRSSKDGVDAQAEAQVSDGPMNASGAYRPVPKFYSSPLLDNEEQCLATAQNMRAESVRQSRVRKVTMAPDPRLELDDAVELVIEKGTPTQAREWGYVVGLELPLTVGDGPGRLDVAIP